MYMHLTPRRWDNNSGDALITDSWHAAGECVSFLSQPMHAETSGHMWNRRTHTQLSAARHIAACKRHVSSPLANNTVSHVCVLRRQGRTKEVTLCVGYFGHAAVDLSRSSEAENCKLSACYNHSWYTSLSTSWCCTAPHLSIRRANKSKTSCAA